jgi:hypothetical protein
MRIEQSISLESSTGEADMAYGNPFTTDFSRSEKDLPREKMGMLCALRSRKRESFKDRVWMCDKVSDFAITGRTVVSVDKCRMIVMSTGLRPAIRRRVLGPYGVRRRRLLGRQY